MSLPSHMLRIQMQVNKINKLISIKAELAPNLICAQVSWGNFNGSNKVFRYLIKEYFALHFFSKRSSESFSTPIVSSNTSSKEVIKRFY